MGRADSAAKGVGGGVAESRTAARKTVERAPRRVLEGAPLYALAMIRKGIALVSSK